MDSKACTKLHESMSNNDVQMIIIVLESSLSIRKGNVGKLVRAATRGAVAIGNIATMDLPFFSVVENMREKMKHDYKTWCAQTDSAEYDVCTLRADQKQFDELSDLMSEDWYVHYQGTTWSDNDDDEVNWDSWDMFICAPVSCQKHARLSKATCDILKKLSPL